MTFDELTEALWAAEGPSRNLDRLIAFHVKFDYAANWVSFRAHQALYGYHAAFIAHSHWLDEHTPLYTQSFDAALTLVPAGREFEVSIYGGGPANPFSSVAVKLWMKPSDDHPGMWRCRMSNKRVPAQAVGLCFAALKMRESLAA